MQGGDRQLHVSAARVCSLMIYDIYLTAIGCIPGGSGTRLQTKVTYNNSNSQHQQYIEQTIYPPLCGCKSADRAPSVRGIP